MEDDGDDDEGLEEVYTIAAMLFPVKFFFVAHGCIISYSGQDVKRKSENILGTALGAVGHVAVGMPLLLTPTFVAGGEFAKVKLVLVLVHVLHYPYYRHDVNSTGEKTRILSS